MRMQVLFEKKNTKSAIIEVFMLLLLVCSYLLFCRLWNRIRHEDATADFPLYGQITVQGETHYKRRGSSYHSKLNIEALATEVR